MGDILDSNYKTKSFLYRLIKKQVNRIINSKKNKFMKKLIFVAVLLLSVSFTFAQLNFGIKAGYSSSLGMNDLGEVTSGSYNLKSAGAEVANGFHFGAFARLGEKLYLQPELLYGMEKKSYDMTVSDANNSAQTTFNKTVNVSTVDIPLLVGYKVLDLKLANLRVFAGPKFRLNAGSSLDYKVVSGGGFTQANFVDDVKAAQVGLEAGFGVDVLMLALDFRYNVIGNMYKTKLNTVTIDNIPANNFVISLGWKIF